MSLLVVGALHWDVVLRAPRLPQLDETLKGSEVAYRFGGKGGNQAVAAAAAGARVAFAGRVGSDAAGDAMRDRLKAAGVDVSGLQTGQGASGMSAAIVTADGSYGAVIVPGENHGFDLAGCQIPDSCRMVLMQNEMAPDQCKAVAASARARGIGVVINAAPATGVDATALDLADLVIANRVEAAQLLGLEAAASLPDPAAALDGLRAAFPRADIVITLGGDGAIFARAAGEVQQCRAHKVRVQSTHGAGDVFVGTLAARLLCGDALSDAVAAGQRAAADHISRAHP